MKNDDDNTEGFVQIRRGILEHIRKMNTIEGENGKPDRYPAPTPHGLFHSILEKADLKTGICKLTYEQWAEYWGCSSRSIRRAMRPLFKNGYLRRLYPNRPDVFIPKFERWDKQNKTWVRVSGPKIAGHARMDKTVRTNMASQGDKNGQAGGQNCPGRRTEMAGQVDKDGRANSGNSLEEKDSQQLNKLIKDKEIKNKGESASFSKPQKQHRKPGAWMVTEELDRLRREKESAEKEQ